MAELDKFKRRVIRTVARMIREKQPEDEMWRVLQTETACDCQLLWKRMKSLTIKKMKRLLIAEDKVENIIPVARMSLTDWLMFDLVLVHEDIDVIGGDLRINSELRPLNELMELVIKLGIEGKKDVALAQAWTTATIAYNKDGRQCSPMLLQRRWYQMKKVARTAFYKFWFNYRGNSKLLENCKDIVPSKLQMEVAQRYPHIITKPFPEWEEMIENKFVILPHEIEKIMKAKVPITPSANDSNEADVVVLEPNIETIDLSDGEADIDNSNADKENAPDDTQTSEKVVVKTEPTDETMEQDENISDYSKSLTEILQQRGEKLLASIPNIDDDNNVIEENVTEISESVSNSEETESNDANVNVDLTKENLVTEDTENQISDKETDNNIDDSENLDDNLIETTSTDGDNISSAVKPELILNDEESMETENDFISEQTQINDLIVMPQIANVFSNVKVTDQIPISSIASDEEVTASQPLMNVEEAEPLIPSDVVTEESIPVVEPSAGDIPNEFEAETPEIAEDAEDVINQKLKAFLDSNKKIEPIQKPLDIYPVETNKDSLLDVLGNDTANSLIEIDSNLTFADDGIELIEDDEFEDDIIKPIQEDQIKMEKDQDDSDESESNEENNKFDLKLLMQPVVYTTKLDDMVVLKNVSIEYINDKNVLDSVFNESKPISKISQNVKEEKQETLESNDDTNDNVDNDSVSETSELGEVTIDQRVKLSNYLLQKPRSRTYSPIQLCKNPDFNTRLKRLTVGFLSSTRNRSFLKTLKPITIDVSKVFESKLINGTMYLHPDENKAVDKLEEEVTGPATSVVPSAMPVQSLINALVEETFPRPNSDSPKSAIPGSYISQKIRTPSIPDFDYVRKLNQQWLTAEVTPMKQHQSDRCSPPVQLLRPIATSAPVKENVSNNHNIYSNDIDDNTQRNGLAQNSKVDEIGEIPVGDRSSAHMNPLGQKSSRGKASIRGLSSGGGKAIRGGLKKPHYNYYNVHTQMNGLAQNSKGDEVEEIPVGDESSAHMNRLGQKSSRGKPSVRGLSSGGGKAVRGGFKKPHYNYYTQCRSKPVRSVAWISKIKEPTNDEALLTIDTLNRMLVLMKNDKLEEPPNTGKSSKKKKKQREALANRLEAFEKSLNSSEDQTSKSEDVVKALDKKESDDAAAVIEKINSNVSMKPRVKLANICCWARWKIDYPKSKKRHRCPRVCVCCCRQVLLDTRLRQIDTVTDAIESTIDNSRVSAPTPQEPIKPIITITAQPPRVAKSENTSNSDKNPIIIEPKASEVPSLSSNVIEIDDNDDDDVEPVGQPAAAINKNLRCYDDSGPPRKKSRIVIDVKHGDQSATTKAAGGNITILPPNALNAPNESFNPNKIRLQLRKSPSIRTVIDKNKEKLIYLNNKHSSNSNTANPIFLGRNKILLTDEQVPPNLGASPIKIRAYPLPQLQTQLQPQLQPLPDMQLQPQLPTDMQLQPQPEMQSQTPPVLALPEGVQIVLLPDGKLSYTVDPSIQVDPEQLAILPTILAAIQQQIDAADQASNILLPTQNTGEIVNLDNDEAVNPVSSLLQNTTDTGSSTNAVKSNVMDLTENANENNVNTLDGTVISNTNENIIKEASEISNINETVSKDLVSKENEALQSTEVEESHVADKPESNYISHPPNELSAAITVPSNETTDEIVNNNNSDVIPIPEVRNDNCSTEEIGTNTEKAASSRSTLLSDLMEMSGISAEDTAPSEKLEEPPKLVPILQTSRPSHHQLTTSPKSGMKELSSITSFAQLKYACKRSGNFFKLDLDTGGITPISVCLKKNLCLATRPLPRKLLLSNQPKSVIDLTDGDDPPVVDDFEPPAFVISKPTQSLLKDTFHLPNSAKPLKIFKSSTVMKPKNTRDAATTTAPKILRKRKQILETLGDSDDSFDENLAKHNETINQSDYESSDDEPLAVISKRMKTSEGTDMANNEKNADEVSQATTEKDVERIEETPAVSNKETTEVNDVTTENIEEYDEVATEITFLSDHDDDASDDNCILGV